MFFLTLSSVPAMLDTCSLNTCWMNNWIRVVVGEELSGRNSGVWIADTIQALRFRSQPFGERSSKANLGWIHRGCCEPRVWKQCPVPGLISTLCSQAREVAGSTHPRASAWPPCPHMPPQVTQKAEHLRGMGDEEWRLPDSWDSVAGGQEPCSSSGAGI